MNIRSKLLLLSCLPLLAFTGIVIKGRPHPAQLNHSQLSSSQPLGVAHAYLKGNQSMALNTAGYTASGAGTTAANTSYLQSSTNDGNGQPFFRSSGGQGLVFFAGSSGGASAAQWQLYSVVSTAGVTSGSMLYNSANGAVVGTMPLTGWTTNQGVAPAPTFAAAPAAPTGVSATPGAGLGVVINCGNAASQPSGTTYNLLESTSAGGEGTTPVASGITLPYTQQETTAGTKYYVLQAASGGATANSAEVSALAYNQQSGGSNVATGAAQAPAAGAVTALTGTLADNGTAPRPTLAWVLPTSGTAPTGFNVRRGTTPGGESATPLNSAALAATATGFVDTTALYATDYYYLVDSLSSGATVTSPELHIKTDTSRPSLTVTPGNGVNTLNITNGGGTLGVAVYRCLHGGTLALYITLPSAATSYPDTAAVNGTAYDYQVFDLD